MQNIRCKSLLIVVCLITSVVGFKWLTSYWKDRLLDVRNGRLLDTINESRSSLNFNEFSVWLDTLRGWKNVAVVKEEGCISLS